jgi:hypothetical protein
MIDIASDDLKISLNLLDAEVICAEELHELEQEFVDFYA